MDLLEPRHLPSDLFGVLLESSTDGVWLWDVQNDRVLWSPSFYETLGIPAEAREVGDILELTHPDDREAHRAAIEHHLEAGGEYGLQVRLRRADGEYVALEVRGVGERDEDGRPLRMVGYVVDVTERVERTAALERAERRFRSFMTHSPIAAFLKDSDTRHLYVNPAAAELAGTTVDGMLGHTHAEIFPPEMAERLTEVDRQVLETGELARWTGQVDRTDGSWRWVHDVKFPVELEDGSAAVGGFGVDLTELRAAQEAASRADRLDSLGRLASGIAHDFNNMLSIILEEAGVALAELPEDSTLRPGLQAAREAAQRSAALTGQLLGFARQSPVASEPFDPTTRLEESLEFLTRLLAPRVRIELDRIDRCGDVLFAPTHFDQVLMNLCINARDAMNGEGVVRIGLRELDAEGDGPPCVELTVRDEGCGMDDETLERVFEPFFTTKEEGSGTGLGLATVHGVVTQNGGCVDVESAPGRGSTFRVRLPLAEVEVGVDGE